MAANDEFQRGLVQSSGIVAGGAASVTFPAAPGVAWVLTAVKAFVTPNASTGAIGLQYGLASEALGFVGIPSAAVPGQVASDEWQGQLQGTPGAAVSVSIASGGAAVNELIVASAYPV